jgi:hypothetical protein
MSIKQGFWWGKLSGLLAGGVVGALGYALTILVDAALNGRLQTDLDWFWQMILYGFLGLFTGAILGAVLGTILGVLIAWTQLGDVAPAIWSFAWAVAGLLNSLVPFELRILLSPIVWVWVGGAVGWYCGHLFLNGVMGNREKTTIPTQADPA